MLVGVIPTNSETSTKIVGGSVDGDNDKKVLSYNAQASIQFSCLKFHKGIIIGSGKGLDFFPLFIIRKC